jgi:hypothetical protein
MNRLAAFDADDLNVISALVQDAVCKVGDIQWTPANGTVLIAMNRFKWEGGSGRVQHKNGERLRSVLHFSRVSAVRASGVDQANREGILSLLAVTFTPSQAPSGTVELAFSGHATLRLDVECLEAALSDTDAVWSAVATPRHAD